MKHFIEASTLIYTSTISILQIVISNCSLLNPGPKLNSIHDSGISISIKIYMAFLHIAH